MRVRILQLYYIGSTDCDNSVSAEMFFFLNELKRLRAEQTLETGFCLDLPALNVHVGPHLSFVQALYTSLVFHSTTYSVSWAILFLTQEIGLLVLLF